MNLERIINAYNNIKFVYNYTNPESDDQDALELISDHSLRVNYLHKALKNKLDLSVDIKYSGEKFIFPENVIGLNEKITLEDYVMVDILAMLKVNEFMILKLGYKNIMHYNDDRRFLSDSYQKDLLTTYDPGGRFVFGVNLTFN